MASAAGGKRRGILSFRPSASFSEQANSAESAASRSPRETTTRRSASIVMKPRSKARSNSALRQTPLRGSARRCAERGEQELGEQ